MNTAGVLKLIQAHNWPEAKRVSEELLLQQPTNPMLHAYRGLCYFEEQNWTVAAESFRRATFLDPKFWQAASKLAQCYERLHEYRKGLEICEEFIRIQPNDPCLESLLVYFGDMAKVRQEGWERTRHLSHHVTMAKDYQE